MFTFPTALYAGAVVVSGTTFDPAKKASGVTLTGGNLVATTASAAGDNPVLSTTSKSSGKFYFEMQISGGGGGTGESGVGLGNASTNFSSFMGAGGNNSFAMYANGQVFIGGSNTATYALDLTPSGTFCGVAVDIGGQLIWWRVTSTAGTWNAGGTANPATGVGGFSFAAMSGPYFAGSNNATTDQRTANFGATSFNASAPAGFSAWG